MSTIEKIDNTIDEMISKLAKEFGSIFTSDDRKAQIVKDIAKLRASMSPQCDHKK